MNITNLPERNVYGALLNPGCRFFDKRIGQSTTLTGRTIAKHMDAFINECITGVYDHSGDAIIYGDTDSVEASSTIRTSAGETTVEDLFLMGNHFWQEGGKEYSSNKNIQIAHFSNKTKTVNNVPYDYVYRHKVTKKKYKITTQDGNSVSVTEDHSVMVLVNDTLIEKKPQDLVKGDKIISLI